MAWYVYIAEAATKRYYVGITTQVTERIEAHNKGEGSQMARQQGPFILRHISAPIGTKADARKREAQIKRWSREKKEKLIRGEWN